MASRTNARIQRPAPARGRRRSNRPLNRRRGQRNRLLTRALPLLVLVLVVVTVLVVVVVSGSGNGERTLARRYLGDWSRRDFAGMYGMLAPASKSALTEAEFTADYTAAAATATQSALRFSGPVQVTDNVAESAATISTSTFGTLHETARVQLSSDGKYVDFSPGMVFPGLRPGETLTRTSVFGRRGNLLASNGQPLAEGTSVGGAYPDLQGLITGSLGPIPAGERSHYEKLGYPADAQVGQDGLEAIFQNELAGTPGGKLKAGSRVLATAPAHNGKTVRTTLDPTLENDANAILGSTYSGMVVLNDKTGAVEAAVGLAFTDLQPPGSTFKIITASAALQYNVAKLTTTFPMETEANVGGFIMQNAAGEECGGTLIEAFATSCDTTYAPLGIEIGAKHLLATAERFGFNAYPGFPTAYESTVPKDILSSSATAVGQAAIGQWQVQASPLEIADAGAAIANDGARPIPSFDASAKPRYVQATTTKVAGELQQMMIAVVADPDGTGYGNGIPGYTMAGKTGTAELASTANQANDAKETDAWFVGYVPGKSNLVVCALFPADGYGADSAAPAVRDLLEDALGVS